MQGLAANLWTVHALAWAFAAIVGVIVGTFMARRDVGTGTSILVLAVLCWSIFIGLIPIINNAIQPGGFSYSDIGQFFQDAAPQAIFSETPAHRNEVLLGAGIAVVVFAMFGFLMSTFMRVEENE